jgi:integrase/recombinase XerD
VRYRIKNQVILSRVEAEGPLALYLAPFAQWLRQTGYVRLYIMRHVLLAACFSNWLKRGGVLRNNVTSQHAARYLKYRYRRKTLRERDPTYVRHFIEFLRSEQVIPAEEISTRQVTAVDKCVQAYVEYLREERALAKATIYNYFRFTRLFLKDTFGSGPVKLSSIRARDVVDFVQRQARRLRPARAKNMTNALRSFLRYARYRGDVTLDLAAAVPTVANWSMASIPRAIAPDQVRQLLAGIDRHTAKGRRDYAIILLLARLGVRAGEVVSLELDDIDWAAGQLKVRGKGGRCSRLPLPADVGKAIAAYLRRGRPASASRRVFLRSHAPYVGFQNSSSVCALIEDAIKRAGVNAPTRGAHQFRHGLATEMLRHDASLAEIGGVLGHRHPDTTRIYTKVDLKALRTLARPWPGDAR